MIIHETSHISSSSIGHRLSISIDQLMSIVIDFIDLTPREKGKSADFLELTVHQKLARSEQVFAKLMNKLV